MNVHRAGWFGALAALWLAVIATAVGCVYAKHQSRRLFVTLLELETERDDLEIEWGKLRIEQSTWATHGRVENLAREDLDMIVPSAADVLVVEQ
jgi:cell division protein FtsL